ncbi:MAG: tRNA (guanosine(37)-N1)-methyltransferase TrmD [Deltaproteobacteria bacterium]|jgi:tRNA (guanine37-N1)-methyltransferase|nr:tRNA (guanosine(37)-N1)-methyltransferase TrmD [Deltaproteobacteria bacterium]
MRFDILTIFPNLLDSPLQEGIIRRAVAAGKISVNIHDIREFALDRHAMTDDRPFGGGEGMVMKPEPIAGALAAIAAEKPGGRVVFLSPQGGTYTQETAERLAGHQHLILLCGRYEGVDERIRANYVDEEISIGDYILTGGELAAMVLVDSVTRLLPGVLGCNDSAGNETFSSGLLKNPQYTRPREFEGHPVPEVLLSGDHAAIAEWRLVTAVRQTLAKRPELLARTVFSEEELRLLKKNRLLAAVEKYRHTGR